MQQQRISSVTGARVAINGRTIASTTQGIEQLGGGDQLIAASGDIGTAAGCVSSCGNCCKRSRWSRHSGQLGRGWPTFYPWRHLTRRYGTPRSTPTLRAHFSACVLHCLTCVHSEGNIVNLASDAGLIGENGLTVYCASKGGVVNLTRAMALELAPSIRVNCVCPGYVDTDMVRRDGIDQADDPQAAETGNHRLCTA